MSVLMLILKELCMTVMQTLLAQIHPEASFASVIMASTVTE